VLTPTVGDLGKMIATLRRFDGRGPRRLALVGAVAFVTGVSEAGVLALVTSAAVASTGASEVQSVGPLQMSYDRSLALAAGLLAINLVGGFSLAGLSGRVAAESGLAARQHLLRAFHATSYEQKSSRRIAALQERLTTYVDRFMAGFVAVTALFSAALSLASFATMALIINPLAFIGLGVVGALVLVVQRPADPEGPLCRERDRVGPAGSRDGGLRRRHRRW
jgi:hypothetical protein